MILWNGPTATVDVIAFGTKFYVVVAVKFCKFVGSDSRFVMEIIVIGSHNTL